MLRLIEGHVSDACLLRAEGREEAAIAILKDTLPALIAAWSRQAGLPGEQCQAILRELFARIQQQVATAAICKRLVLQSMAPVTPDRAPAPRPGQLRRRVPLHDIPGMLDALDESERSAAFRLQHFPSNSRPPNLALALG